MHKIDVYIRNLVIEDIAGEAIINPSDAIMQVDSKCLDTLKRIGGVFTIVENTYGLDIRGYSMRRWSERLRGMLYAMTGGLKGYNISIHIRIVDIENLNLPKEIYSYTTNKDIGTALVYFLEHEFGSSGVDIDYKFTKSENIQSKLCRTGTSLLLKNTLLDGPLKPKNGIKAHHAKINAKQNIQSKGEAALVYVNTSSSPLGDNYWISIRTNYNYTALAELLLKYGYTSYLSDSGALVVKNVKDNYTAKDIKDIIHILKTKVGLRLHFNCSDFIPDTVRMTFN